MSLQLNSPHYNRCVMTIFLYQDPLQVPLTPAVKETVTFTSPATTPLLEPIAEPLIDGAVATPSAGEAVAMPSAE